MHTIKLAKLDMARKMATSRSQLKQMASSILAESIRLP
jgi:hypothetical protein